MTLVETRPVAREPRPWHFPRFERRDVEGGRVISCHLPGKSLALVSLVVDIGAVSEPGGREGVAEITARALSEGTELRDAYGFGLAGERLGAAWRTMSDWDSLRCGFEVPIGELGAATELLAEAVRRPSFDPATVDRVRDERLDEIRIERSQPSARAMESFIANVFDSSSRYATSDGGTVDTVVALNAGAVSSYHSAVLRPDRATLIIVGDLATTSVDSLGETVFGGWTGYATAESTSPTQTRGGGRRIVVVDRPGAVQSMVYAGHDGISRTDEDYVPTTTMSLVLGGMFSSRLNMKLREEKGYAYGAFGGFDARKAGGLFVCRSAVQSDVTVPALIDMVGEIERMQEAGVEPTELEQARNYRAGVFPLNFAGVLPVGAGLGDVAVHGFGDDHFDRLRQQVLDVTKSELDAAASRRLRPDDLTIVVVGDAESVVEDLRASGLGPVEVVADKD